MGVAASESPLSHQEQMVRQSPDQPLVGVILFVDRLD
jgi:hypothetical protein